MKLKLILINSIDMKSETETSIEVFGKETLGWLLVKSANVYNLDITNNEGFFRSFKMAADHYALYNGINLSDVSHIKKPIRELFSDGSRIYLREFFRAKSYTPENPSNKDDLVKQEYNRVEALIVNFKTPNTLKNITLGFIKANLAHDKIKLNQLPVDLVNDLNGVDNSIGNPLVTRSMR